MKLITNPSPSAKQSSRLSPVVQNGTPRTVLIGLGNDLLSDDGVGLYVARALRGRLDPACFDVKEACTGGMGLVDLIVGYRRAVIVDACRTGMARPGTITRHKADEFAGSMRLASYHTVNFATAIELARQIGADLPDDITIFTIEVEDVETFGERCTAEVEASIEVAADTIERFVRERTDDGAAAADER